MPDRLQGKVALITGAGSGIGRACARLIAREGASVVIAELARESGLATEAQVLDGGGQALFVETDVTDEGSVVRALDAALSRFGAIHTLVNCAGGSLAAATPSRISSRRAAVPS